MLINLYSDTNYVLQGFKANYTIENCSKECSGHGSCSNSQCTCNGPWHGKSCDIHWCPELCNIATSNGNCDTVSMQLFQKGCLVQHLLQHWLTTLTSSTNTVQLAITVKWLSIVFVGRFCVSQPIIVMVTETFLCDMVTAPLQPCCFYSTDTRSALLHTEYCIVAWVGEKLFS
jgi:hypothetical protein